MSASKILKQTWNLNNQANHTNNVEKYCPNCGKLVTFRDSGYRRQNANGKNIFHFAIFKCDKGHTWNKKLEVFSAKSNLTNEPTFFESSSDSVLLQASNTPALNINQAIQDGFTHAELSINVSGSKQRLDKLLTEYIEDFSRTQIAKMIAQGLITLDFKVVKPNAALTAEHLVNINFIS